MDANLHERLTIIVPVFNESLTVGAVIARLRTLDLPVPTEILIIDDGSTDGTREALSRLPASDNLRIIHASRNGGKGSAVRLGLTQARGTIVAIQDADLELDPAQLSDLVKPILDGSTAVVFGSRFLGGRTAAPWVTVTANRALTSLTNLLFGSRLTDMETCYKVMRLDVARSLHLRCDRFDIEPEITSKLLTLGHRITELPVTFNPRTRHEGKKMKWRDGFQALAVLVRYRMTSSTTWRTRE